jgi:hypothetical protein
LIDIAEINSILIISRNDRPHPKKSCEIYLKKRPKIISKTSLVIAQTIPFSNASEQYGHLLNTY